MRTITQIIEAAGGAPFLSKSFGTTIKNGEEIPVVNISTVYKWQTIGIVDRHWEHIIPLASTSPQELYEANQLCRKARKKAA